MIDMKTSESTGTHKIGRPLSFDRQAALHQAMLAFWRHGYEATSLRDLTGAMGVTSPSIYAAFGDKKHLFLEAVGHYCSGPVTAESIIENAMTAKDAAQELLQNAAVGFTGKNTPPGCLLASSAISCSTAAADVQKELASIRQKIEKRLKSKIDKCVKLKNIPIKTDSVILAGHVMVVIQGMSTLARDGASREKLLRIAEIAMRAWPVS